MSSPQKRDAGIHAWFVAAMGLAAVAGYGWGSVQDDAASDAEREVSAATKVGEKPRGASEAGPATAREFVRSVIDGSIDERQQWRHVRSFTEDEVKAALADLEKLDRYLIASPDLRAMLFYRWAEFDPVAANAAARKEAPKGPFADNFSYCRRAVIAAWINQGGAVSAWNAVRDEHEAWACTRTVPGEVADMLVASLSDRDDMAAFKEVLRLDDDNCEVAEGLCRARAGKAARSPESRAAFLAAADLHPKAYVRYSCARDRLAEEWAKVDAEAAEAAAMVWEKEAEEAQRQEEEREEAEWKEGETTVDKP